MFQTGLPGESEIGAALSLILCERPGPGLGRATGGALALLRLVDAFQVLPQYICYISQAGHFIFRQFITIGNETHLQIPWSRLTLMESVRKEPKRRRKKTQIYANKIRKTKFISYV